MHCILFFVYAGEKANSNYFVESKKFKLKTVFSFSLNFFVYSFCISRCILQMRDLVVYIVSSVRKTAVEFERKK